jgi:hypothetical protein
MFKGSFREGETLTRFVEWTPRAAWAASAITARGGDQLEMKLIRSHELTIARKAASALRGFTQSAQGLKLFKRDP